MKRWLSLTITLVFMLLILSNSEPRSPLRDIPDKMVTLTFDDGPDPYFTPAILKLLKQSDISATFFVVGRNSLEHPEIIQEIAREGHTIGNHTFTHPELEKLDESQVYNELVLGDLALTKILGPTPSVCSYFRPPLGHISKPITRALNRLNKEVLLWNVCVEDEQTKTPEEVRRRVMKLIRIRHGGILLAHDGELDRSLTVQSLPLILNDLHKEGYQIVPLKVYLKATGEKSNKSPIPHHRNVGLYKKLGVFSVIV